MYLVLWMGWLKEAAQWVDEHDISTKLIRSVYICMLVQLKLKLQFAIIIGNSIILFLRMVPSEKLYEISHQQWTGHLGNNALGPAYLGFNLDMTFFATYLVTKKN